MLATTREVDPVARAVVDSRFEYATAYRPAIAEIPVLHALDGDNDASTRVGIGQAAQAPVEVARAANLHYCGPYAAFRDVSTMVDIVRCTLCRGFPEGSARGRTGMRKSARNGVP